MKKQEYVRFTIYLDQGDKALLDTLKKSAKKYRVSVSALTSYSIQAGLPFVEKHFEKLSTQGKTQVPK